ncbi:MAG: BMP family ABC transporter substrate-binding protein [Schwartzia sp.]|nr:BMP family ABC transporter substrate-binding protein [Schwartzia sp. (in: firmicutes)]
MHLPTFFGEGKPLRLALAILAAGLLLAALFRFTAAPEEPPPKVGFIILGDIRDPGWNASHYEGIRAACDAHGAELFVRDHVRPYSGECQKAVWDLAGSGCRLIVMASYEYPDEIKDIAGNYPEVSFAATSASAYATNMTSYFPRMYQGRYLAGALAGLRTKTGVIGYVAAMPNAEICRGINAFALGAQKTNPGAKVVVAWSGAWEAPEKERALTERLVREAGADILACHQDDAAVAETADRLGTDFIAYNAPIPEGLTHGLAAIRCRWDIYYDDILRRHLKGELNAVKKRWVGIDRGAVLLDEVAPSISADIRGQLYYLRRDLANGQLIFIGPIYDNRGVLRCEPGETISDDTLLSSVDWLVRGVTVLE